MNKNRVRKILRVCGASKQINPNTCSQMRLVRWPISKSLSGMRRLKSLFVYYSTQGYVSTEDKISMLKLAEAAMGHARDLVRHIERLQVVEDRRDAVRPNVDYADSRDYVIDKSTISFTTDPITFDGVELGRFQVVLDTETLVLRAVALEPNPACPDESVTHPNIRLEQICMGDGRNPFNAFIEKGLYFHALDIAVSVVRTNGEHSPHVHIDDWNGYSCRDCADSTLSACEDCECHVCDECQIENGNGVYLCRECVPDECSICDERYDGATCEAPGCLEHICDSCHEESQLCPDHYPSCITCGDIRPSMDSCPRCGSDSCSECFKVCNLCEEHKCQECTPRCDICEKRACDSCSPLSCADCVKNVGSCCMQECECGENVCTVCFNDQGESCSSCMETEKCTTNKTPPPEQSPTNSDPEGQNSSKSGEEVSQAVVACETTHSVACR